MQSDIMPVQLFQLSPQLASIQTQLRTAIANHQMVFGSYQKDPKNAVLRDKLQEMQLQIRNLSNHQTVIVEQLRGQLIQNAVASTAGAAAAATTAATTASSSPSPQTLAPSSGSAPQNCSSTTLVNVVGAAPNPSTPQAPGVVVTPSSSCVAKPVPLQPSLVAPRPQLLTLPHGNLGIVVPFAHIQQAQPALMALQGGVLSQPGGLQATAGQPGQPLVSLQLSVSSPAAAILTPHTTTATTVATSTAANATTTTTTTTTSKENNAIDSCATKPGQAPLRAIQPRPSSPPIKVPQYTMNTQSGTGKASDKSNGMIQRSFSESDAKDLKAHGDHSADKDPAKTAQDKNFIAEKMKIDFMSAIGLVTPDASKAIQNRRVERKRRSTANPHYSYSLERRRNGSLANNGSSWLMGTLPTKRAKGRQPKHSPSPANSCPGSPDSQGVDGVLSENKGGRCAECGKDGRLLLCGTCALMYHLDCLSPPLAAVPESPWSCAACIVSGKSNGVLSNGALSMVNSYITVKANKEDDKKKAQRKNIELLQEKQNLLEKKNTLKQQVQVE